MKIIHASVSPTTPWPKREEVYDLIEKAGRTCYLSEQVENDTPGAFIKRAIDRGHESILEHISLSLRIICDRGVSHELVRHRLASYSQESTRYCNYSKDKFDSDVTFILPNWIEEGIGFYTPEWVEGVGDHSCDPYLKGSPESWWFWSCANAERSYLKLLEGGWTPQQARSVLPNSLKTEMVMTANIREWRHFLNLRYFGKTGTPHPQMVEVANRAWKLLYFCYPYLFEDLKN